MNDPKISLIVALCKQNKVIGKAGQIPWSISEDLKKFKEVTMGHPIIMGRKTYESIGKPLPGRISIIITHDGFFQAPGCIVCNSLEDALSKARAIEKEEVFIIGGGQIFEQAIHIADKLYLTEVEGDFEGDAFFPDYSCFNKLISEQSSSNDKHQYKFLELEKEK